MNIAAFSMHESYKPAGIDWIEQIPSDWQVLRIQDFSTFNDEVVNERSYRNRKILYVDISGVDAISNTYSFEEQEFSEAPSRARRLAKAGDTVFSTVRPYLKAVATISTPEDYLVFSTGFAVIRPRENADSRFVGYVLRNERFIDEVTAHSVGASYPAINAPDLVKLHVPFPQLHEQRAIAAFLDDKCAKIDKAVRIKEKQIKLLTERRQILIQQAVTRGLNPDAPMKDSGIDWIGEIPAHWEVRKIKQLFRLAADASEKNNDHELLSIYTDIGVKPRKDLEERGNKASTTDGYWLVKKGDFIVNKLLAWMGAIGISEYNGVTSPAYDILRPRHPLNGHYYHRLFRSKSFALEIKRFSRGIMEMRLRIYFDKLGILSVPFPSKNEQDQIIDYLARHEEKINSAISIKEDQITTLKEYKTSLINAAVTGKIKII
nr:restriction endonuclease subunit S [uncultured Halomonas sp.]